MRKVGRCEIPLQWKSAASSTKTFQKNVFGNDGWEGGSRVAPSSRFDHGVLLGHAPDSTDQFEDFGWAESVFTRPLSSSRLGTPVRGHPRTSKGTAPRMANWVCEYQGAAGACPIRVRLGV